MADQLPSLTIQGIGNSIVSLGTATMLLGIQPAVFETRKSVSFGVPVSVSRCVCVCQNRVFVCYWQGYSNKTEEETSNLPDTTLF